MKQNRRSVKSTLANRKSQMKYRNIFYIMANILIISLYIPTTPTPIRPDGSNAETLIVSTLRGWRRSNFALVAVVRAGCVGLGLRQQRRKQQFISIQAVDLEEIRPSIIQVKNPWPEAPISASEQPSETTESAVQNGERAFTQTETVRCG